MKRLRFAAPLALGLLALVAVGCSDDDNPSNGGGGNGGDREFSSPDLTNGQSFQHVFTTPKVVPYYCSHHGAPGGVGMAGTITVVAGGTPSLHQVDIVASTLPTMSIDVGDTVRWTNLTNLVHDVRSDN